jgi:pimeloyl-ACP methyl ester carboxylesterase
MWRTASLINGVWEQSEPHVIEGTPPSLAQVLAKARTAEASNVVQHLEEEQSVALVGNFVASHDAIARWSALAEAEAAAHSADASGKVESMEEALGYFAVTNIDSRPDTLAWHDHTTAIIRIPRNAGHITIDYTPSQPDEARVKRYTDRVSPQHELETILDARGYYGTDSAVIDHWTSMRRNGWGFRASIAGMGGYIVARVLRRLKRSQPALANDPTFAARLARMLELYPAVGDSCPDLARVADIRNHADAIVFVHGTVSSSIQSLKDLCANRVSATPIYRFEHDTFRPIHENANQLARLIGTSVRAHRILLVGHSRGGLVARIAVARLRADKYPGEIYLQTFGTPHEGTPLADVGGQFLNLVLRLGCDVIGSVAALFPAVAAYSYLIDCPTLPLGIEVMRQASPVLGALNAASDASNTRCWSSRFDIDKGPSGFGAFVTGGLGGMMSGIDHDLVVPTASALAFGTPEQPLLACSHVNYFSQPAVKQGIEAIAPRPQVVVAKAAASENAYTLDKDMQVGPPVQLKSASGGSSVQGGD